MKVKHIDGGATADPFGTLEAKIDIQEAATQAPGARIISYEAPNTASGEYDAYNRIVDDNQAQVVSTSWGKCEALLEAEPNGTVFIDALHTLFQAGGGAGPDRVRGGGRHRLRGLLRRHDGAAERHAAGRQSRRRSVRDRVSAAPRSEQPGIEPVWNDCEGQTGDSSAASGDGQRRRRRAVDASSRGPTWQPLAPNATVHRVPRGSRHLRERGRRRDVLRLRLSRPPSDRLDRGRRHQHRGADAGRHRRRHRAGMPRRAASATSRRSSPRSRPRHVYGTALTDVTTRLNWTQLHDSRRRATTTSRATTAARSRPRRASTSRPGSACRSRRGSRARRSRRCLRTAARRRHA